MGRVWSAFGAQDGGDGINGVLLVLVLRHRGDIKEVHEFKGGELKRCGHWSASGCGWR